jgi:hypothetical protein
VAASEPSGQLPGETLDPTLVQLSVPAHEIAQERQLVDAVALERRDDFAVISVELSRAPVEQWC